MSVKMLLGHSKRSGDVRWRAETLFDIIEIICKQKWNPTYPFRLPECHIGVKPPKNMVNSPQVGILVTWTGIWGSTFACRVSVWCQTMPQISSTRLRTSWNVLERFLWHFEAQENFLPEMDFKILNFFHWKFQFYSRILLMVKWV